jgi:predicted transcriptional regulator
MGENFVLVSLKEDKAKKLAQVISNDTCRALLDHLAKKKDATESDISKELKLPLSTVHYNLQHLVEAKLVQAEEFHYSPKGKEVLHYSLTNKFVIIAPRDANETFLEKLKKIMPVAAITLGAAAVIQGITMWLARRAASETAGPMMLKAALPEADVAPRTMMLAQDAVREAAGPNIALWFLYGAVFAIMVFVVYDLLTSKRLATDK